MSDPKFVAETPQDRERRLAETPVAETTQPIDIKQYLNVYEFEANLIGTGQTVKFKPVTTGQMKKLLVYEQADSAEEIEKALDELISSCVTSPDFDINKLYLQDRFDLLLEIRAKTKGEIYSFQWTCPVCELRQPTEKLLSDLERRPTTEMTTLVDINESLKAEFTFPTREIQKQASEMANSLGKMNDSERMYETGIYTYALCMSTFHTPVGKTQPSLEDKYNVLNNISTKVMENIQKWMEENTFGIDFSMDVKCINPECGFEHNMDIPVSDFFV